MKLKFVEVEWEDAQHSTDVISLSELKVIETVKTKSCGYLVKEDKERVILGFMLFDFDHEDPLIKHYQAIPKGMVKKIKVINNET